MIEYREHDPGVILRACLECIWTMRGHGDAHLAPSRILPDGCMEAVLNFGDRPARLLRVPARVERGAQTFRYSRVRR